MLEMAGKSAALERWLADNEKKAVTGKPCLSRCHIIYVACEPCLALFPIPVHILGLVASHVLRSTGSVSSARAWLLQTLRRC